MGRVCLWLCVYVCAYIRSAVSHSELCCGCDDGIDYDLSHSEPCVCVCVYVCVCAVW